MGRFERVRHATSMQPLSEDRYRKLMSDLKAAFEIEEAKAAAALQKEQGQNADVEALRKKRESAIKEINLLMRKHGVTTEMLI